MSARHLYLVSDFIKKEKINESNRGAGSAQTIQPDHLYSVYRRLFCRCYANYCHYHELFKTRGNAWYLAGKSCELANQNLLGDADCLSGRCGSDHHSDWFYCAVAGLYLAYLPFGERPDGAKQ